MSFLRNLTMKSQLLLLSGVFCAGFVVFGTVATMTLSEVKVNGPSYAEIIKNKDLLADVLPPPAYIVEPCLVVNMMPRATTPEALAELTERMSQIKEEFIARQNFWTTALADGPMKQELLLTSRRPVDAFFTIYERELLPLVQSGDSQAACAIIDEKLMPLFNEHRASIVSIVEQATEQAHQQETLVASIISQRTFLLWIIGATVAIAFVACSIWLRRFAVQLEERAIDSIARISAISKNQSVIEFQMDGTIVTANDNFLNTLGYTIEEIKGKHHSIFVDDATKNSSEYRDFWVQLNHGENLPGEYRRIGKNGKQVVVQASYNSIPDSTGKLVKVVEYATDVTEMAKDRAETARVHSMMEQAPINVMFADRDFKIRYVNPATVKTLKGLENLLSIKSENMIGQSIDIFLERSEQQRNLLADPRNLPHRTQTQIGPETLDLLVSPVFDQNNQFLGSMVTWEVITSKLKMERDIKENAIREKQKAEEMAKILHQINSSASTLSSSAEELTAVSTQMSTNAEETSAQANVVSAASEQVSVNVQVVATGVEEMNSSIREIAKNATESARVAGQAVSAAELANVTISKLGESSSEIGKVIKVITSIAEQTNLLALNATIEAARAGDAGKGFAVVANEVKELAKETAKATEDISHKIEAIQSDTYSAVDSIKQIGVVIAQINDISNTIASAVEEQTATASEMSRNVALAAKGTSDIARNITSVAKAAQNTTQGASNSQQASNELARMADELQRLGSGNTTLNTGSLSDNTPHLFGNRDTDTIEGSNAFASNSMA